MHGRTDCQQDALTLPRLTWGRYETAIKLGSSAFGMVVLARNLHTDGTHMAV